MTKTMFLALSLGVLFAFWALMRFNTQRENYLNAIGQSNTTVQKMKLLDAVERENNIFVSTLDESEAKRKLTERWKKPECSLEFDRVTSVDNGAPIAPQDGNFRGSGSMSPMLDFVFSKPTEGIPIQLNSVSCQSAVNPAATGSASVSRDRWKTTVKFRFYWVRIDD